MNICESKPFVRHRTGVLVALTAVVVYGLYPSAARAVYADGGNAILVIMATTWARALAMAFFCFYTKAALFQSREDRKQALIGGFAQAISIFSIFLALLYIPGPLVLIIYSTHTILLLFFLAWRGKIRLDAVNIAATVMALFGLTLVLDVWHTQPGTHWIGMGLAAVAALVAITRLYVYGEQTKTRNPMVVGAENYLVAAVLTIPALIFEAPQLPVSLSGGMYLLVGCLSLAFATSCMFYAISILGAFEYSLLGKIEPIFTSLFSVLILNEVLKPSQYAGVVLVVGSLAAYQVLQKNQRVVQARASADEY